MALSIAGSDSGGGAGIVADLKTFEAFGVWGTTAITAITAQNTLGVHDVLVLPGRLVRAQVEAVVGDMGVDAVKTGMLGSADVIKATAAVLTAAGVDRLVIDPVLVTSHREPLLEAGAVEVLRDELLPMAALITPNLAEAEALLGTEVRGVDDMVGAAERLGALGPAAVLLKGGHLDGATSPDLLWTAGAVRWLDGPRIVTPHTHGTGCVLSAAICAQLACGIDLTTACVRAKQFVTAAIGAGAGAGIGTGIGPIDPGWGRRGRRGEAAGGS